MKQFDILIIGAGAAGIAAAKAACAAGCTSILLVDRGKRMGGVLIQCAHPGFGDGLTGPEYIERQLADFPDTVRWCPDTTVVSVSAERRAVLSGPAIGVREVAFRQLILATGCMETPMGALSIAGTRPSGVYTAGQVQAMMNLYHQIPEEPAVILGSGDMGLIMAKALTEAGREVAAVVEQKPRCGGMLRNRRSLRELSIPLILNATITEVIGETELIGVTVRYLKTWKETFLPCKTLLIAAGLRPDRELVRDLGCPSWLHLCGNCARVHPMVESVLQDGGKAGRAAYQQLRGDL